MLTSKPRLFTYTDKQCWAPTVCSVDDAWFEGATREPVLLTFGLGGIHNMPKSLSLTIRKLKEQPSKMSEADAMYLEALAVACQTHGFALSLCNFAGLRSAWNKLNSAGNAILLDLHFAKAPPGEAARNHGLRLVHELLNGDRPTADIFVVTGAPTEFGAELEAQVNSGSYHTWWPIRALPVVSKLNHAALTRDLECFARYFAQGNRSSPVADLLRSLVWACNAGYRWSHPDNFTDVPRNLMLYSLFESDCDSVKALFHNKSGPYPIRKSVLLSLLRSSGYIISCDDVLPETIVLPRRPFGAIWVAQLMDLLGLMLKHADAHSAANLRHCGTSCILEIPLNPEHANEFVAAVAGERAKTKGRTTDAYEALQRHKLRQELRYELNEADRDVLCQRVLDSDDKSATQDSVTISDNARVVITWEGVYK